jgi:Group II intron, maturase-specific domain
LVRRACSTAWRGESSSQPDRGEVIAKRKGVTARWGPKEAWSKSASRWTRTGYEASRITSNRRGAWRRKRLRDSRSEFGNSRGGHEASASSRRHDLAEYLRGWIGYFGRCETPDVLNKVEQWIRRRLRLMVWKQWKRGTTRYRELRQRGIAAQEAARMAGSSDGPWHLANTPALKLVLSNACFAWTSRVHGSWIAQPATPPDADPPVRWCGRGEWATTPLCRWGRLAREAGVLRWVASRLSGLRLIQSATIPSVLRRISCGYLRCA